MDSAFFSSFSHPVTQYKGNAPPLFGRDGALKLGENEVKRDIRQNMNPSRRDKDHLSVFTGLKSIFEEIS